MAQQTDFTVYSRKAVVDSLLRDSTTQLDSKTQLELIIKSQKGDLDALNSLVKANIRLVFTIAKGFQGKGIDIEDLINIGCVGLTQAIEDFDPAKGNKLSTYAAYSIKKEIRREIRNHSRTIRIPVHLYDTYSAIVKEKSRLEEKLGREPSAKELAKAMAIKPQRLIEILNAFKRCISLDSCLDEDNTRSLHNSIADPSTVTSKGEETRVARLELIHNFLNNGILTDKEKEVIRLRFPQNGQIPMILEDIAKLYGVTRQRIDQIEKKALAKIKVAIRRKLKKDVN